MKLKLQRETPFKLTTYGALFIDEQYESHTLEDMLREILGRPASEWKVKGETAIAAGVYELYLVDSPKHGKDTIRLRNVDGFDCIDIHSGVTKESTEGCITVGDTVHPSTLPPSISGGLNNHVLERLKAKVVPALKAGEACTIEILNPPGWGA